MYINKSWFYSLNLFLKNEVFLSNSTLLENSAADNKKNLEFLRNFQFFFKNRILLFYIYYFFVPKIKILLFSTYNNNSLGKTISIDRIYKSAS